MIATQVDAARPFVGVVAAHAVPVENRLHVAREIRHVEGPVAGIDAGGRPARRADGARGVIRVWRTGARLMAAGAAQPLARHDLRETLHAFDGAATAIQSDEKERAQSRGGEVGGAVRLDRHGAQHARQREGADVTERIHAAGEVDGFGQRFKNHEFGDSAFFDAGHLPTLVDVLENKDAIRLRPVGLVREERRTRASCQRPGLVEPAVRENGRQREKHGFGAAVVHQHQLAVACGQIEIRS